MTPLGLERQKEDKGWSEIYGWVIFNHCKHPEEVVQGMMDTLVQGTPSFDLFAEGKLHVVTFEGLRRQR